MKETLAQRINRLERWFGVKVPTGDLNSEAFVSEIERDVPELAEHLAKMQTGRPVVDVGDFPDLDPQRRFPVIERPSPNFTKDYKLNSKGILIHASYGKTPGTVSWITQRKSGVSYHVVIDKDGTRYNIVDERRRAWHAGKSSFRGRFGCNNFLVGVAFSENTYDRELTEAELASLQEYVSLNKDRYGWEYDWCTDHRTVAPTRKSDINPAQLKRALNAIKPCFA